MNQDEEEGNQEFIYHRPPNKDVEVYEDLVVATVVENQQVNENNNMVNCDEMS